MEKWFHKWGFKINEKKSTNVTINNITVPNKDSQIPGHDSGQEINLETTYPRRIQTTQGQTQKILLAHWPLLQPKHTEQNYALQDRNKNCLDLRNPTMGNSK